MSSFRKVLVTLLAAGASVLPALADDEATVTVSGLVRGSGGAPVANAVVWLPTYYGSVNPEQTNSGGGAVTDGAGRYSFTVKTKPLEFPFAERFKHGISAQARGFVRAVMPLKIEQTLRGGETLTFNIELQKGEILAGTVELPIRLADRVDGLQDDELYLIEVKGNSFSQSHSCKGVWQSQCCKGDFAIWVPKGVYTIKLSAATGPASWNRPPRVLTNVPSGTRGLRLAKDELTISAEKLAEAFDALWQDMFWYYSYFELKGIDWPALGTKYRQRAIDAGTLPAFVDVLGEMLGELDDGHVRFLQPSDAIVAHDPRKLEEHHPRDQNFDATESAIEGESVGNYFATVGTTKADGFGVVRITRMSRSDDAAVEKVVEFIRAHADVPGFIIDLRGADGGSEEVAQRIAREFCGMPTIYALSKYRGGPDPGDFGPTYDRVLEATNKPYTKPVVCILGPGCISSGEAFAKMMRSLPHVTTVGRRTRGSSGNPRPCSLPGVPVTVLYSRWVDMLPDGTPVEGRGVPPNILVELPEEAYKDADPTWKKAVETLRAKVRAL